MSDIQFHRINDRWALAADRLQWVLQRRKGVQWEAKFFVRSHRDILARCLRESGVPAEDIAAMVAVLPPTFDAWKASLQPHAEACVSAFPPVAATTLAREAA